MNKFWNKNYWLSVHQCRLLALVLLLLISNPCVMYSKKWNAETLPIPHLNDERKYVTNPDGVLSNSAVTTIDNILYALEKDKGIETVVAVVKQIEGNDPYQFGMNIARKYGVGSKSQRTGLIIVLATEDRSYQILTGNGLEATLPDAICRRIQNRYMLPELKVGNWDAAMVKTVTAIEGYVRKDASLKAEISEQDHSMSAVLGLAIALVVCGGLVFFAVVVSEKNKCPKCKHAQLRIVNRNRFRIAGTNQWCVRTKYRCPRCGYEKNGIDEDDFDAGGSSIFPPFMGIPMGGAGSSHGPIGGSFGGGSFGGGGSGGRF